MGTEYNRYNLEAGFKNFLSAENVSTVTLKNYLSDLRHFLGWLQSSPSSVIPSNDIFEHINAKVVQDYKSYLLENKIPLKTVNRRLSTLRKFFTFCISQGWMKENPAKAVQNHKTDIMTTARETNHITKFKKYLEEKRLKKDQIEQTITDVKEFLTVSHSL